MIRPWVFEFFPELDGAAGSEVSRYFGKYLDLWKRDEELGFEGIFFSEHHFGGSFSPSPNLLIAATAARTSRIRLGVMALVVPYYAPARIIEEIGMLDHLSGGRLVLGLGAGWFQRDYDEYGYAFGEAKDRLRALGEALPRIKERLAHLTPPPMGSLPILIGGGGEKVTLRLVAEHADMWNGFGPADEFARKNRILDEWCAKVGRDPKAVERTVLIDADEIDQADAFLEAGAEHLILATHTSGGRPYDLAPLERLLRAAG